MKRHKITQLAKQIKEEAIPGHDPVDTVVMRQAIVQTGGFDITTGLLTVQYPEASTPIALPFEGWPPGDGEVCWVRQIGSTAIVTGSTTRSGWLGPWRAAWGVVDETVYTLSQDLNSVLSFSDFTGVNLSYDGPGNRYYIARVSIPQAQAVTFTGNAQIQLQTGLSGAGTLLHAEQKGFESSEIFPWKLATERINFGAGTIQIHLRGSVPVAGAIRTNGNVSGAAVVVQLEDVGPATLGP
jgi:hypothetical protein